MGHVGMEKKNPFVMTIGFDKNDPEHVEVAKFLNSFPRKKAQYIVEAVRCYRQVQQGGSSWGENTDKPLDKKEIRQIVLQILAEQGDINIQKLQHGTKEMNKSYYMLQHKLKAERSETVPQEFEEINKIGQEDLELILDSIDTLRN